MTIKKVFYVSISLSAVQYYFYVLLGERVTIPSRVTMDNRDITLFALHIQ